MRGQKRHKRDPHNIPLLAWRSWREFALENKIDQGDIKLMGVWFLAFQKGFAAGKKTS